MSSDAFDAEADRLYNEKLATAKAAWQGWCDVRAGKLTHAEATELQRRANAAWRAESDHWDPERMRNKHGA